MGGSGSNAGVVGVCCDAGYTGSIGAVDCGASGRGADACVEELHISLIMMPIPRRLSRAVGPPAFGLLRLEYNDCGEEGDEHGLV